MRDFLPADKARREHVLGVVRDVYSRHGFDEIETPVVEDAARLHSGLGGDNEKLAFAVMKRGLTTEDLQGAEAPLDLADLGLRFDLTVPLARFYASHRAELPSVFRSVQIAPVWRAERPQKGRYRQFHQIDAELIGSPEPLADVELLVMADHLLKELGISDGVALQLNTLGDVASRDAWRAALIEYFRAHKAELSEDSQDRLERNPLRILDSKDPRDKVFVGDAPKIDAYLSAEAQDFFAAVTAGLNAAGVAYERAPSLVRGLDYYRHTAFEFVTTRLGAQGTVLGGGRYDGLMESLGGAATPAVGWAAGIERLAMLVADAGTLTEAPLTVVLAVEDDAALGYAQKVITALRFQGLDAEMVATGSPRKRFDKAVKMGARVLVSFGAKDGQPSANLRAAEPTAEYLAVEQVLQSVHP